MMTLAEFQRLYPAATYADYVRAMGTPAYVAPQDLDSQA